MFAGIILAMAVSMIQQRVDLIVRPECLRKPIHMVDCNLENSGNEKCHSVIIDFKPECAEINIVTLKGSK